jgi:hypothetical protein
MRLSDSNDEVWIHLMPYLDVALTNLGDERCLLAEMQDTVFVCRVPVQRSTAGSMATACSLIQPAMVDTFSLLQ